jgi:hypothetical protein
LEALNIYVVQSFVDIDEVLLVPFSGDAEQWEEKRGVGGEAFS